MSAVFDIDDATRVGDDVDAEAGLRLVDLLLEEQQSLSAVEEFAAVHADLEHDASRYESLIPAGLPGVGQQFAFRVDLDACTGCKACVTACHSLNGLDDDEAWRRVGLVEGRTSDARSTSALPEAKPETTHQQTVTTACHHCEEPACLAGCPVRAYEKDATTGIVRHLDDQCIGCRYCQLMCPYDVPTYSERLGIVRKCDLCHDRLAEGEAPACVQGCPNEAISISLVDNVDNVDNADNADSAATPPRLLEVSLGGMPDSRLTLPTTRYVSSRSNVSALEPGDVDRVQPSEAHTPLALMLVFTQVAIGAIGVDALLGALPSGPGAGSIASAISITAATAIGLAGLTASIAHLGRPQWAFRALLGLRTSWMSREIVVLGGFAGLLVSSFALGWIDWAIEAGLLSASPGALWTQLAGLKPLFVGLTSGVGLLGLFCSIQIYAVTGRPLWRFDRTARRFVVTAAWAGVAVAHLGLAVGAAGGAGISPDTTQVALIVALVGLTLSRLRTESGHLIESDEPEERVALDRTRRLLARDLLSVSRGRRRSLVAAGLVLPVMQLGLILSGGSSLLSVGLAVGIVALGIASDVLERSLFFRAEAMPSMPGMG